MSENMELGVDSQNPQMEKENSQTQSSWQDEVRSLKESLNKQSDLINSVLDKNKRLYKRAKDAEEELGSYRGASNPEDGAKKDNPSPQNPTWDDIDNVSLRLEGYSQDEIDFIKTYSKGQGKRMIESLKDKNLESAVFGLREKKVKQTSSPENSSTRPVVEVERGTNPTKSAIPTRAEFHERLEQSRRRRVGSH